MHEKAARNRKVANRHLNNQVWSAPKANGKTTGDQMGAGGVR